MTTTPKLSQLFAAASARLWAEFTQSTAGQRPDEKGRPRERAFRQFLEQWLPSDLSITSGYVVNRRGDLSPQCDVIVFRPNRCPKFIVDPVDDIRLVPVDDVYAVLEVKSTLTSNEFDDALRKLQRVQSVHDKNLRENQITNPPFLGIFAYRLGDDFRKEPFLLQDKVHHSSYLDVLAILESGTYVKDTGDHLYRIHAMRKGVSLDTAREDKDAWHDSLNRFIHFEDSYYNKHMIDEVKNEDVLFLLYGLMLDSCLSREMSDYNPFDYVSTWNA
ncbi:hypothetical protein LDO26_00110 [Luteimonas sp. BDR2-5]|uniref:DUF6602 domain-containing protein n=1 Tax=Proluteimonas luteida TaxID=2878685 RepID=UPI001E5FB01D|nr:DUF6602 domain-containing protein [Luteimonas sp. BDR2-5]MCD9026618.1 hypothetical protein [Luteimonas sp. BDR2-5]